MKILLENMEDKAEVMERLYQEGPAKLPPIQDDFVCKMISCRAESDPEVESEIPGLASASYKAMGISLAAFANLQLNDDYCQEIRETMGNKGMKWLFAEIDGILVRLPPSIHSKKGLKARLTPNTPLWTLQSPCGSIPSPRNPDEEVFLQDDEGKSASPDSSMPSVPAQHVHNEGGSRIACDISGICA